MPYDDGRSHYGEGETVGMSGRRNEKRGRGGPPSRNENNEAHTQVPILAALCPSISRVERVDEGVRRGNVE